MLLQTEHKPSPTLTFQAKGSRSGRYWNDGAVFCNVKALKIFHGECIHAIQINYEDKDGKSIWSEKHGGNVGLPSDLTLELDEYLISVHGYHGSIFDKHGNPTHVIRSLTFETNQRTLGPFGIEKGIKFSFPTTGLIKIVGFHGRCGWYLDSIGFHFVPISVLG
ncbi:Jacalin-related lectin 3, partial [Cucurbita argyrosperma subsp. sororia]